MSLHLSPSDAPVAGPELLTCVGKSDKLELGGPFDPCQLKRTDNSTCESFDSHCKKLIRGFVSGKIEIGACDFSAFVTWDSGRFLKRFLIDFGRALFGTESDIFDSDLCFTSVW